MLGRILLMYAAVAVWLFPILILIGFVLKKDILHGGVKLGLLNSIMLSVFWPFTFSCVICGWLYDFVQAWRRL